MASLHIHKGELEGKRLALTGDTTVLGRNPDCQVVVQGNAVSRWHARIMRVDGRYFIQDGDHDGKPSRNGTFVNGKPIAGRTLLKENDRIKICDFSCTFHLDAKSPLPAGLQPDEPDDEDEDSSTSTFEATLSRASSHQVLESQPADKLKALIDISNSLGRSLEFDTLVSRIGDNLLQLFRQADRCFLIQRDEGTTRQIPRLIKTRRAGGETSASWSKSIVKQCLDKVEAFLSEDATTDSRFGLSQSIADFRIRSVMCAPMCTAEGVPIGVIQVDTQDRSKRFTQDDLKFLVAVANQIGTTLENARLHESLVVRERYLRDLELAQRVQRSFLPQRAPQLAGYEFYAHYESAQQVGGDYYDFIPLTGERIGVTLGDVAGKGVPAALLMAKLSAECRFCMLTEPRPGVAITRLNALLTKTDLMDRFVTLAVAVVDPLTHVTTVVNAGHQTPLLFRQGTASLDDAISPEFAGLPLGVGDDTEYASGDVELKVGDCLLLFTDGVTDATSATGALFGLKGIQQALASQSALDPEIQTPAQVGQRVVKALKQHMLGAPQADDIAVVCLGRVSSAAEEAAVTAAHRPQPNRSMPGPS